MRASTPEPTIEAHQPLINPFVFWGSIQEGHIVKVTPLGMSVEVCARSRVATARVHIMLVHYVSKSGKKKKINMMQSSYSGSIIF